MKKEILKIAGVKSEKEFYKKYPTEAAFMKAHKKEFKKAAMGAAMVNKQLTQLTDFSNPPQAQDGKVLWHPEWEQDQYAGISDDEAAYLAEADARNVANTPMKTPSVKVSKTETKKPAANNYSVVDFMNSKGLKSDFNTRKSLAQQYGIKDYKGTAEQNMQLLSHLKGKTPATKKVEAPKKEEAAKKTETVKKTETSKKTAAQPKPKLSKAEQYIADDPYFFAEKSDPEWIKAVDAPFSGLRNLGARVVLDRDPKAALKLAAMGALGGLGRMLLSRTEEIYPYNPNQIGAPPPKQISNYAPTPKQIGGRPTPTGWSTESGLRSGQYPIREYGGIIPQAGVGDYIGGEQAPAYKPLNYTELYDQAEYANTGSNRQMRIQEANLAAQQQIAANSNKKGGFDLGNIMESVGGISQLAESLRQGGYVPKAQFGDILEQLGLNTASYKKGTINSPTGQVTKAQTEALGFKSDGSNWNSNKLKLGLENLGKGVGEGYDKLDSSLKNIGGVQGGIGIATDLIGGFQQLKQEKQQKKKANQAYQLSGLTKQVAGLAPEIAQRKYVRPEDMAFGTQEMGQTYGAGTNFLAANGAMVGGNPTEIQNMYNPGDIYSDMGYEPLSDSEIVKQYRRGGLVPRAQLGGPFDKMAGQAGGALGSLIGGGKGRPTAGGKIGSTVGSTVGNLILPGVGGIVGGAIGGIAGGIFGGKSAAQTARWEEGAEQNTQDAAFMSGVQGVHNQFSNVMKDGGSIVDYMSSKGMNSSYNSRKELYKKVFGDSNFSGTAEQNTKLLQYLKSGSKPSASVSKKSSKPSSSRKEEFGPLPGKSQPGLYDITAFPESRNLESGVIVDKNTNNAYILKGNKIVKSFPVLTGQARDANVNNKGIFYLEDHPEDRATPTGSYFMNLNRDIYGSPGFDLAPIDAFGYSAPLAKRLAQHVTYDPAERDKYYNLPGEQRNKSYGCINCKKPDIGELTSTFAKGDTTMVIDTRNPLDRNLLSTISKKEDGGWVSHNWQPQVITQFGGYDLKDLLRPDETMDTLRAGGHLRSYTAPSEAAMSTERPDFAMGGQLKTTWGGYAEPVSQNPYLPGSGETVMFRGKSHDESDGNGHTGIGVKYGSGAHDSYTDYAEYGTEQADADVEVERGEPAVELPDSETGDVSMVVYGNMPIPSYGAAELGDPKIKGKKFKTYANDLSKMEAKQNKIVEKGTKLVDGVDSDSPFDLLKLNAGQAMIEGANMKLKGLAIQKQRLAGIQNAILDTAEEMGVESDALAKGHIKKDKNSNMAKFGGKFTQAQVGDEVRLTDPQMNFMIQSSLKANQKDPVSLHKNFLESLLPVKEVTEVPYKPGYTSAHAKYDLDAINKTGAKTDTKIDSIDKEDKFGLDDLLRQVQPYLIPSNQEPFDYGQITPELYALASNQLEPVQAQTFQPLLEQPYSVSFQDQLNANQADFNALQRQLGYNPAAASALAAQKYAANSAILGQQARVNQEMQMGAFNRNRGVLNDAALKNLAILDQQYQRQSQAKSATKAQAQAALSSIADKIAKNKLENRTLGVYENMYNYRFGPKERAINVNAPYEFNTDMSTMSNEEIEDAYKKLEKEKKSREKGKSKNGSIVKAIKNL